MPKTLTQSRLYLMREIKALGFNWIEMTWLNAQLMKML